MAARIEGIQKAAVDWRDLWSGWLALVITAGLQTLLPGRLSAGPGWVSVLLIGILAATGLLTAGRNVPAEFRHAVAYLSLAIVTGGLSYSIARLVLGLQHHRGSPAELLQSAAVLWFSNVLVFAVWYWRLDHGGPHRRAQREFHESGAFLFPQMTMSAAARRAHGLDAWQPRFVDYLFLAFTTSTALSPTDVPVLSRWAKVLMMLQAAISLLTLALLAARAVNLL